MAAIIGRVIQGYTSRKQTGQNVEDPENRSMIEVMLNDGVPEKSIFEEVAITLAVVSRSRENHYNH